MAGVPLALAAVGRHLPLALVWLLAAWPVGLWLLHLADPEAAVAVAHGSKAVAWRASWWLLAVGAVLFVAFPPAPAWVRRTASRLWLSITADQAPLVRARGELRHFETASKHAEVGRLLRLRRQNGQALAHLARAVELDGSVASAWHQLGLVSFSQHDWRSAANACGRAEQLEPGHAFGDALLHAGRALHELGEAQALPLLLEHRQRHGGGPRSLCWL
ncbi:MAG: hypothetical protein WAT39_03510, partial [Planctomycetota bacterium]